MRSPKAFRDNLRNNRFFNVYRNSAISVLARVGFYIAGVLTVIIGRHQHGLDGVGVVATANAYCNLAVLLDAGLGYGVMASLTSREETSEAAHQKGTLMLWSGFWATAILSSVFFVGALVFLLLAYLEVWLLTIESKSIMAAMAITFIAFPFNVFHKRQLANGDFLRPALAQAIAAILVILLLLSSLWSRLPLPAFAAIGSATMPLFYLVNAVSSLRGNPRLRRNPFRFQLSLVHSAIRAGSSIHWTQAITNISFVLPAYIIRQALSLRSAGEYFTTARLVSPVASILSATTMPVWAESSSRKEDSAEQMRVASYTPSSTGRLLFFAVLVCGLVLVLAPRLGLAISIPLLVLLQYLALALRQPLLGLLYASAQSGAAIAIHLGVFLTMLLLAWVLFGINSLLALATAFALYEVLVTALCWYLYARTRPARCMVAGATS